MRGSIVTRTQKDGTKKYAAVLRINGKQTWKTFDKYAQAEDYLDRNSRDTPSSEYRESRRGTFGQYAEHWKDSHAIVENIKPSTLNAYLSVLEKHIEPEFRNMGMQAISSAEINSFKA